MNDHTPADAVDTADTPEATASSSGVFVATVAGIVALVVALGAVLIAAGGGHGDQRTPAPAAMTATSMPMVAPDGVLDLATVTPAVAAEYTYARDHADAYRQLRCWCGCEKAFAHRSLADCFVRADGNWEAHGAGCGVCLGEATAAHQRLDAGDDPAVIARDLDAQYGPDPTSTGA